MVVNGLILLLILYIGATAKRVIEERKYEQTLLILPTTPPPPPKEHLPPPPKLRKLPAPPEAKSVLKYEARKFHAPKPEPKPEKPIQMEAKAALPTVKAGRPAVILSPQPKAALRAAMPAQDNRLKPSTAPVHLGQTFGVPPNPNATRPATVAAIGNPYGGMNGRAVAPHGVVGSTGIGNGLLSGSNSGVVGKVASAGIPGMTRGTGTARSGTLYSGRVAPASIPAMSAVAVAPRTTAKAPASNGLEIISKPVVQYTSEARQLKVQGDVILRVNFTASGRVEVRSVVHGLGHGLDEEARRVAQQIRFRPATRDGQPVDSTTNITITFQLA
jgi:TonB family protein